MAKQIDLTEVTLRKELSTRGGGIEIDLTRFGFKNEKMSAYQNYLGGGMLGRIMANNTIQSFDKECTDKQATKLDKIAERLKRYYFDLAYPDHEDFEIEGYEENQKLAGSAY